MPLPKEREPQPVKAKLRKKIARTRWSSKRRSQQDHELESERAWKKIFHPPQALSFQQRALRKESCPQVYQRLRILKVRRRLRTLRDHQVLPRVRTLRTSREIWQEKWTSSTVRLPKWLRLSRHSRRSSKD